MAEEATGYSSAVNKVIQVCYDAAESFRGTATAVEDFTLQSLFNELSSQRAGFANDLLTAVAEAGFKPEDSSGVLGTLHHGWITLKGVRTRHSEHQILEQTERSEDFSISRYHDALKYQLPVSLRSLLEAQYQHVQQAHNRIKELRHSSAKVARHGITAEAGGKVRANL